MPTEVETQTAADVWFACTRYLSGHGVRPVRETLAALVEEAGEAERADQYGVGDIVQGLESRIAELLGKEAALFFPTGTMTQQIALRLWCDRAGRPAVAFHPTCHLEIHEQHAY